MFTPFRYLSRKWAMEFGAHFSMFNENESHASFSSAHCLLGGQLGQSLPVLFRWKKEEKHTIRCGRNGLIIVRHLAFRMKFNRKFTWTRAIQIKPNERKTNRLFAAVYMCAHVHNPKAIGQKNGKKQQHQLNGYMLHMQTMVISAFCVQNKSNNKSNFKTPFPIHGPTQTIIIWQITAIQVNDRAIETARLRS